MNYVWHGDRNGQNRWQRTGQLELMAYRAWRILLPYVQWPVRVAVLCLKWNLKISVNGRDGNVILWWVSKFRLRASTAPALDPRKVSLLGVTLSFACDVFITFSIFGILSVHLRSKSLQLVCVKQGIAHHFGMSIVALDNTHGYQTHPVFVSFKPGART